QAEFLSVRGPPQGEHRKAEDMVAVAMGQKKVRHIAGCEIGGSELLQYGRPTADQQDDPAGTDEVAAVRLACRRQGGAGAKEIDDHATSRARVAPPADGSVELDVEACKPVIELRFVLLDRLSRPAQANVIRLAIGTLVVDGEHAIARFAGRSRPRARAAEVSARYVEVVRGPADDVQLRALADVVNLLTLGRLELAGFPAVDVVLRRAAERVEDKQLGVLLIALCPGHPELINAHLVLRRFPLPVRRRRRAKIAEAARGCLVLAGLGLLAGGAVGRRTAPQDRGGEEAETEDPSHRYFSFPGRWWMRPAHLNDASHFSNSFLCFSMVLAG